MQGSRLNTFNSAQFVHWHPESRARRILSCLRRAIPGVLNPYARVIQRWNKFFLVSCLLAIFLDPLFFFSLSLQQDNKCMVIDWPITTPLLVLRSMNDLVYLTHMLLQFRLAYVAGESVVGAGELVDHPKQIALKYLSGYFLVDFFILLPLPQIIITLVLPKFMVSFAGNYEKTLLGAVLLLQYVPRLYRFLHSFSAQYPSGFIFESTWKTSIINLFGFGLSGHVVGSCWYIFGLQRVVQCLQDACHSSGMDNCQRFIDCRQANYVPKFESDSTRESWKRNENVTACFSEGGYSGIYVQAVNLTRERNPVTRYAYSFFWGFQQISTLAGNQNPSYFLFEVLFAIAIIGLGLFLLQNLLQSLSRSRNFSREVKLSQRRHDVEHWMSHWRLPAELRREVRQSERYRLIATRGVNEERLLENLPEDLQREIRWHRSKFIKKVRVFSFMDEPILDAVRERLRQKTYIKGNRILDYGVFMDKMVFIIRGKMESIGENGLTPLREGDVCGEELLTWCFEHSHVEEDERKIRFPGLNLLSKRSVICLTNVEVFVLLAADLQDIFSHFSGFLRNPRVQHAIRYESPYWRSWAAAQIQRAWRYRQRRLRGADTSIVQPNQQIK